MSKGVADALQELDNSNDGYNRIGLWVGRVEDVDDPSQLNRVRVRIFHLHGDKRSTPTNALPWCEVVDFGGGGFDYGSGGRLYPEGSTVWLAYEMGDEDRPVVIGGRRGSPVRDDKNPVEFLTTDGTSQSKVEDTWLPEEGNEIPKDIFADSADEDTHPTRSVWNKSFRGHTILVEDRRGREFLRIIDRAGQVIEMDCPVDATTDENNSEQRGNRNAIDDTQVSQSSLVNGRAFIRLKDIAGQEVILDGKSNGEEIRLTSRNRQGSVAQQVVLSSAKGREKIELIDKAGNKITIDPNSDKSITITDASDNEISFDNENGEVNYIAANSAVETVGSDKTVNVTGKLEETIGGDRNQEVLGNAFLSALNDLSANVSGMTSALLSGAMQVQVVNAPADGIPKTRGMDVNVSAGNARLQTTLGNINLETEFETATVNVGSEIPTDAAALYSKVQTELQRLKAEFDTKMDALARHRHPQEMHWFPLIPNASQPIIENLQSPLVYGPPGQAPVNAIKQGESEVANAPMDENAVVGQFVAPNVPPTSLRLSGLFPDGENPGETNSQRLLVDK